MYRYYQERLYTGSITEAGTGRIGSNLQSYPHWIETYYEASISIDVMGLGMTNFMRIEQPYPGRSV